MSSFPPATGAQDKCVLALEALEAELAAQDEKFASLAKTMALTADSLSELYAADGDAPVPADVIESLRNVEIDLQRDGGGRRGLSKSRRALEVEGREVPRRASRGEKLSSARVAERALPRRASRRGRCLGARRGGARRGAALESTRVEAAARP